MAKDVLIIDADGAAPVVEALRSRGVSTRVTDDGKQGIELALERRPDAIILCAELPSMSGYSICAKIKKDPVLREVPLIFTSSQATESVFEHHKKLKVRADEYLSKPFDMGHFMGVLGQHMMLHDIEVDAEIPLAEEFSIDEPETAHDEDFDVDAAIADAAASLDDAMDALSEVEEEVGLPEPLPADEEETRAVAAPPSTTPSAPLPRPASPPSPPAYEARSQDIPQRDDRSAERGASGFGSSDVEALQSTIHRLESELESLRQRPASQVPGGARDALALKKELNAKDRELFDLRNQLHEKDGAILELRDKETELEGQVVQLEEERNDLDHRLTSTQRRLDEVSHERDEAQGEAHRAVAERDEAAQQKAELQRELETARGQIQQLRQRCERSENEKSAAEAEAQQLRMQIEDQKMKLERANGRIDDLEHRRDALISERDDLQQRLGQSQDEKHTAETRRRKLEESAKKARQALTIAQKMLNDFEEEELTENSHGDTSARA